MTFAAGDASFRDLEGFNEMILSLLASIKHLDYSDLIRRKIGTCLKNPDGFLVPLLNDSSSFVIYNIYFTCMDGELFRFMESTRSNESFFTLDFNQFKSSGIYCLLVSIFLPDTDEEFLMWMPVDSELFCPYYEDNAYVKRCIKIQKHVTSLEYTSTEISPYVSFIFGCLPKMCSRQQSVSSRRLLFDDVLNTRLRNGEKKKKFDCLYRLFPHYMKPYTTVPKGYKSKEGCTPSVTYILCDEEWKVFSYVKYEFSADDVSFNEYERSVLSSASDVSFVANNKRFQFIMFFRKNSSERNVEFVIHTSREMEEKLDASNSTSRYLFSEMMDDEDFWYETLQHVLDMIPSASTCLDDTMSLKESVMFKLLVSLYKRIDGAMKLIADGATTLSHSYSFYEGMSEYVYRNQLFIAKTFFDGDLSAVNCILFTCIALSDSGVYRKKNNSLFINGGAAGIILYFYSLYLMSETLPDRVVSWSGKLPSDNEPDVKRYGTYLPPLSTRFNNALDLILERVRDKFRERYVLSFKLTSPAVSVDYFISDTFQ